MATDKRLDQVSQLTDFDYALIVKGTDVAKVTKQQFAELVGNLLYGATTKETLASVVAEQINGVKRKVLSATQDLDEIKTNGSYYVSTGVNAPGNYFYFEVLKTSSQDAIQVGYPIVDGKLWKRTFVNGVWSSWMSVTFS